MVRFCHRHAGKRERRERRLRLEQLEDRRVLAMFTVTNLDDGPVNGPGDLPGSLRQAVFDSNAVVSVDDIVFQDGLTGVIALNSGELAITDDLTIDGPGADALAIDAQDASRIFNIDDGTDDIIDVTLRGLTISRGNTNGDGGAIVATERLTIDESTIMESTAGDDGGGVRNFFWLTLSNSTVSGNSANDAGGGITGRLMMLNSSVSENSAARGGGLFAYASEVLNSTISGNSAGSGSGGGIYFFGETSTLTNSTVSGNSADVSGGGIYFSGGTSTLTNSTVSGNSAGGRGGGIYAHVDSLEVLDSSVTGNSASSGGGIYLYGNLETVPSVRLSSSSVSGNSAGDSGGGIYSRMKYDAQLTLTNSTVSGNSAGDSGGGMSVFNDSLVMLTNSTVSGNSAARDGGGIEAGDDIAVMLSNSTITENSAHSRGGGIYVPGNASVTLDNTIVAHNGAGSTGPDVYDSFTAYHSLIEDTSGATISGSNNITGQDPLLGPLADNGGPTLTHALLTGSPAIYAGDPNAIAGVGGTPLFDQRDSPFIRVLGERLDIGSYEFRPPTVVDGDFNHDGLWDCPDIDQLVAEIAAGSNNLAFDMTGDGLVNLADRDAWLAEAGAVNLGPGRAYLLGDADLDGTVDGFDFIVWNTHKFSDLTVIPGWCQGNFNADTFVDGLDFAEWNNNKFQSDDELSIPTSPVPVKPLEPSSVAAERQLAEPENMSDEPQYWTTVVTSTVAKKLEARFTSLARRTEAVRGRRLGLGLAGDSGKAKQEMVEDFGQPE